MPRNKELGGDGVGVVELGGDWGRGQTLIGRTLREYVNWAQYTHNTIMNILQCGRKARRKRRSSHMVGGGRAVETGAEAKP